MAELNAVVDLSHHNGPVDLKTAKASGLLGVIQKGTQSIDYVDPTFEPNHKQAIDAGLYWGTYHFGVGGDGVAQADYFLTTVKPEREHLLVLDFEPYRSGPTMTLEEARAFVTHVYAAVGRWPVLYSGHYIKELLGTTSDPVLAQCPLWLAQYGPTPVVPSNWKTWTLWQYTDGGVGPEPHTMAGIGRCDRDRFNGDVDTLQKFWGDV
jgi:lysozyme